MSDALPAYSTPTAPAANPPPTPTVTTPQIPFAWLALGLILIAFPGVSGGWNTFIARDYGTFAAPIAAYIRHSLWTGSFPLWNPLNNSGIPLFAQWNSLLGYPPAWLVYVLPWPAALGWFTLAHVWIAAVGMQRLALAWTQNSIAATVAGTSFAFGGFMLGSLIWPHLVAALAWMPWVVLATSRAAASASTRTLALAALAGALQMLTGAPEIILLTWALSIPLALVQPRDVSAPNRQLWRRGGSIAVLVAWVTGLSAFQLLPFFDLLAASNRSLTLTNPEAALPLHGWMNILLPAYRCARTAAGTFFQPEQFWIPSYYVSLPCDALALLACRRLRDPRILVLLLASLGGLWLGMGDQAGLLAVARIPLPQLNWINFPAKFVVLTCFALPLLAAFGLRAATETSGFTPGRRQIPAVATALAGLALIGLGVVVASPRPYEHLPALASNFAIRVFLLIAATLLLGTLNGQGPRKWPPARVALSLCAVIWLDGLTHNPGLAPVARSTRLALNTLERPPFDPAVRRGAERVHVTRAARQKAERMNLPDPAQTYAGFRQGLFYNCNLFEGIAKTDGFFPLFLANPLQVESALEDATGRLNEPLADFLAVRHLTAPDNALDFVRRPNPMPLLSIGQEPAFLDAAARLARLRAPDFDPRHEVLLPSDARTSVNATRTPAARVEEVEIDPQRIACRTRADTPALLVIAQSWYPAWQALIDGRPARVWMANHAFQAVVVPAGDHRVELRFEDRAFRFGALISLGALAATVFLGCAGRTFRPPPAPGYSELHD